MAWANIVEHVPFFGFFMHSISDYMSLLIFSLHFPPSASQFPHIGFDQFMENLDSPFSIFNGSEVSEI